jgi:iron(II)-dependent oxidoreductase
MKPAPLFHDAYEVLERCAVPVTSLTLRVRKRLRLCFSGYGRSILAGTLLLLASSGLGAQDPSTAPATAPAKFCPTCKHFYAASQRFCELDGVPLVEAAARRENAKNCPRCKKVFSSWAKFCPHDGAPLIEPDQQASLKDARRMGRSDGDNVVGTLERATTKRSNDKLKSAVEFGNPSETTKNANSGETADDASKFIGTAYVTSLRAASVSSLDSKSLRQSRADKLAERFRNKRRIAVAVRVRPSDDSLKQAAQAVETEIGRRLRMSGPRDLELASASTLPKSGGWKRVLIDVTCSRVDDSTGRYNLQLTVREFAPMKAPEQTGELPPGDGQSNRVTAREEGDLLGEPVTQSGPLVGVLETIAHETVRRLNVLAESHFDEGQRFALEGRHEFALEEFIRFLFATSEFDSPQADEANQTVIAALNFSVLDWLWGEPEVAVVEPGSRGRRLPLGFRPATSETSSDELPGTIVCLRDGCEMVRVPAGTEIMGNDVGLPEERPAHAVTLKSYYIDKLETSVAQYERFLASSGYRIPQGDDPKQGTQWEGRAAKKDALAMPVVHVSWHDARAYAQWAGKSLPSEAQWERAARGGFAGDYPRPFDSAFDRHVNGGKSEGSGLSVQGSGESADAKQQPFRVNGALGQLMSVYSFPAALNPFGCQNMLGNVSEWCRDCYDPSYYARSIAQDPLGPDTGELRVVRGGSWQTPISQLSSTFRSGQRPTSRAAAVGFRCVLSLPD